MDGDTFGTHTRLLIERILIATATKLFQHSLSSEYPLIQIENGLKLMNKRK